MKNIIFEKYQGNGNDFVIIDSRGNELYKYYKINKIFDLVQTLGLIPLSIAAFSAGKPKASQPIGCKTDLPLNLWNLAIKSVIT